jgi:hypothetical protein
MADEQEVMSADNTRILKRQARAEESAIFHKQDVPRTVSRYQTEYLKHLFDGTTIDTPNHGFQGPMPLSGPLLKESISWIALYTLPY